FDFFLVVMTLTAIAEELGKTDAAIALAITLTHAFRPVGALTFGLPADRCVPTTPPMAGRRWSSVADGRAGGAPACARRPMARARPGDRSQLEAVSLPDRPGGDDERGLARHPGHVPDVPPAGLGLRAHRARGPHRVFTGGGAHRRRAVGPLLRPAGPSAGHRARAGRCRARDPHLGVRAGLAAPRRGRVHHAVLRARRLG